MHYEHGQRWARSLMALAIGGVSLVGFACAAGAASSQLPTDPAPAEAQDAADEESPYAVSVSGGTAAVGEAATITVTVTARAGFKPNDAYPNKLKKLAAVGNAGVGAESVGGEIRDKTIVFSVSATPKAAGAQAIRGEASFSVCTEDRCVIQKVPIETTVTGT